MSAPQEPQAVKAVIARNLSWLRAERGLSLSELARRSEVAKGTLSKLESGAGNPTLETLWSIANCLGVPLGALLSKDDSKVRVARAADSPWVGGEVLDARILDRLVGAAAVDAYEILLRPGGRHERSGKAPGSIDYIFVTAGRMLVGPADDPVELDVGDFIRYASDQPYVIVALDDEPARGVQFISYAEKDRSAGRGSEAAHPAPTSDSAGDAAAGGR